jgi:hypothetical protein
MYALFTSSVYRFYLRVVIYLKVDTYSSDGRRANLNVFKMFACYYHVVALIAKGLDRLPSERRSQ